MFHKNMNSELYFSTNHKALICVICYPNLKKIFGSVLSRVAGLPQRVDYLTVTVKSGLDVVLKFSPLFTLFSHSFCCVGLPAEIVFTVD